MAPILFEVNIEIVLIFWQ